VSKFLSCFIPITYTPFNKIKILVDNEEIHQQIQYFSNVWEYRVNGDIPAPTNVTFDASDIQSDHPLYRIASIEWSIGDRYETGKKFTHFFPAPTNAQISVQYVLQHIRDENNTIPMKETIYIDFGQKEALLFLEIDADSEYAPTDVKFDASASRVEWENIVKFIYDYDDGTPVESRDAVNPGHRYLKSGDYLIKLIVVTESGKQYSTQKHLILKDMEEVAKIKVSRKKVRVWETINFDSTQSEGLIMQYTWNFWDGYISSKANTDYAYQKPGTYTVELRLDFANNNYKFDTIQIEVE